jgi:hypothetical protein
MYDLIYLLSFANCCAYGNHCLPKVLVGLTTSSLDLGRMTTESWRDISFLRYIEFMSECDKY